MEGGVKGIGEGGRCGMSLSCTVGRQPPGGGTNKVAAVPLDTLIGPHLWGEKTTSWKYVYPYMTVVLTLYYYITKLSI